MIVYIESNFILEIALKQEQHSAAENILALAEQKQIELVFPSFVLSEPFATIMYRSGKRSSFYSSLEATLRDIKRSEPLRQIALDMEPLVVALRSALERDFDPLHATLERLLAVGRSIETDLAIFKDALNYQVNLDLFPQDSIIYASIIADLRKRSHHEKKCFLSRDKKAFSDEDDPSTKERNQNKFESRRRINTELKTYGCQYIGSFEDGLNFAKRFCEEQTTG